jgi:hypothetical protein
MKHGKVKSKFHTSAAHSKTKQNSLIPPPLLHLNTGQSLVVFK